MVDHGQPGKECWIDNAGAGRCWGVVTGFTAEVVAVVDILNHASLC